MLLGRLSTGIAGIVASVLVAACAARPPPVPVTLSSAPVRIAQPARTLLSIEQPDAPVSIGQWPIAYRDAAVELGKWIAEYPQAARKLGKWSEAHPEQFYALMMWSVTHPYEELDAMFTDRWGWDSLERLEREEPDALSDLLDWSRRSRPAAESVARHADALSWFSQHGMGEVAARPPAPAHAR